MHGLFRSFEMTRFIARHRREARSAELLATLAPPLALAWTAFVVTLPVGNMQLHLLDLESGEASLSATVRVPLILAGIIGLVGYLALRGVALAQLELHREYVHGNLVSGGMLLAAIGDDAYSQLPHLGRETGTSAWLVNAFLFRRAKTMRGRLMHLLRTYADCCGDAGLMPWPRGWLRRLAIGGLGAMLIPWGGSLYWRYTHAPVPTDPDNPFWLLASAWAWKPFLLLAIAGVPLAMWYSCLMSAALRHGFLDALQAWDADDDQFEAEEPAEAGTGWG